MRISLRLSQQFSESTGSKNVWILIGLLKAIDDINHCTADHYLRQAKQLGDMEAFCWQHPDTGNTIAHYYAENFPDHKRLHPEMEIRKKQILEALLEGGADFFQPNHKGQTPADVMRLEKPNVYIEAGKLTIRKPS